MEVLNGLEVEESPIFAISSNKDNNIIGFYLTNDSELLLKWIYRSDEDLAVTEVRNFNVLENALFSISLERTESNMLKLAFGLKMFDMEDYYIIKDPFTKGSKCVYFVSAAEGPSIAREVYVDIKAKLAFCKCQTELKKEFVEIKALKNLNIF